MANYTVLSWQNEHSLESFPLSSPFEVEDFLVDASFIQFDGFTPVLAEVDVKIDRLVVTILFDEGEVETTYLKTSFNAGVTQMRCFGADSRYLGCLTLGAGVESLWSDYVGQNLKSGVSFFSHLVRSIPLKDAVYTLDKLYGDVEFGAIVDILDPLAVLATSTTSLIPRGKTVFYNVDKNSENITFNAVKNHALGTASVLTLHPLKKINLVAPIANNVYLASNDIIKFNSFNNQSLNIALVGSGTSATNLVPTLAS